MSHLRWLARGGRSSGASKVALGLASVLALYVGVSTFPHDFHPFAPGVDPSWIYGINVLPRTGAIFGRDIAFSYGPLGYLLAPSIVGTNLHQAALLRLTSQIALASVAVLAYLQRRTLLGLGVFALFFVVALAFPPIFEYRILLVIGLLISVTPDSGKAWRIASAAAGLLTSVLLLGKFSAGLTAVAILVVATAVRVIWDRVPLNAVAAWVVAPSLVGLAFLGAVHLRSPGNFLEWVGGSLEVVRGYPSGFSLPIPSRLLWLGCLSLAAFLVAAVLVARADRTLRASAAALAVLVVIAFRHSFTQSGHYYFTVLLGSMAILVLAAQRREALVRASLAAGLLALPFFLGVSDRPVVPTVSLLDPDQGWNNFRLALSPWTLRRDLQRQSEQLLVDRRLPPEWTDTLQGAGVDVDAVPGELAFLAANHLRWDPNPVIQQFTAITSALDLRAAAHFRSGQGPSYVLSQFVNIQLRHPMLDAPDMWRAIAHSYELEGTASGAFGELAVLRRRAVTLPGRLEMVGREGLLAGVWSEVPRSQGFLYLSATFHPTAMGRLAQAVWKVDPIFMDLRYADGRHVTWRILPSTSDDGMLIAPLPGCFREFLEMFDGRPIAPVAEFRFHGPGMEAFEREVQLGWWEASEAMKPLGAPKVGC
jgi:hypothetical protein